MIFASGLKYVGVGTTALGWILVIVLLVRRPDLAGRRPALAQCGKQHGLPNSTAQDGAVPASATTSQPLSNSRGSPDGRAHSTQSPPGLAEDGAVPVDGLEAPMAIMSANMADPP